MIIAQKPLIYYVVNDVDGKNTIFSLKS